MSTTKQVIVMRTDLNMRKGKMIAQGAHASTYFLVDAINGGKLTLEAIQWLNEGTTKIAVGCDSEEHLLKIFEQAENCGLTVHVVTDSGRTEFNGVETKTCLAIGPNFTEDIDLVTGGLKLL